MIAGPNGAGKTTFAEDFLPADECFNFVNADLIARGLSPFDPDTAKIRAGRLMLTEIKRYVELGLNFALETTLSGQTYAHHIREWRRLGYYVHLVFLELHSVELAIERVSMRVRQGGHDIPISVIRRRFTAGLVNFQTVYTPVVNSWARYDSSAGAPVFIESGDNA